ncbi:MAG: DUF4139 domain-containing protein [Flavobacteriales bacterium]|jgi:uncharacterized protein (TIGR02231 family)|nr:DUF4139 domain-containing protein [Flavobacteriales bacterium]
MKSIITTILPILIFSNFYFGAELNEVKVSSKINNMTLFLTGGEATRTADVTLKKGRNKIIYTGISAVIDQKSIQFNANQPYELVSVNTAMDYLAPLVENTRITTLKDSLNLLEQQLRTLMDEKNAYTSEKQLLEQNKNIKGAQTNLSVEQLESMANFYRKRMTEINKKTSWYAQEIIKINKQIPNYKLQIQELNDQTAAHSNQIIVIVDLKEAATLKTNIKYIVSNCGWQANYDLLATELTNNITLKYKAKVYNNTGNNWDDIKVTLSSANPDKTASAPILKPWVVSNTSNFKARKKSNSSYLVPQNRAYKQYYNNSSAPIMDQQLDALNFDQSSIQLNQSKKNTVSFTTIQVPQISAEFEIKKTYSIPSDSKPYLVEIAKHTLNAKFSHRAVPKLDKDAFLLASIVGWEKLDLIPGPANVYFSDTYVGQSYLETQAVEDTLHLSFGRDNKISIERKNSEEMSEKTVLGNNKKDTYTYEITLKNNQTVASNINLYDQIPISQNSDITVTVNETSGATYDEATGELVWGVTLEPNEIKKVKLSFTIKYPKDRKIVVQKYRTIACPSF